MGGRVTMPAAEEVLPGRSIEMPLRNEHPLLGVGLRGPFPPNTELAVFGMGCFWGAERAFWRAHEVVCTAVGYGGGTTPNPTYEEVCSGLTGHTELVAVWFDPGKCSFKDLLKTFWERHNPTEGMRQGNDIGTQYRSAIFWTNPTQQEAAESTKSSFQRALSERGLPAITTEIAKHDVFFYAEDYHQQYLHKNPNGYCGLRGTGVSCAI